MTRLLIGICVALLAANLVVGTWRTWFPSWPDTPAPKSEQPPTSWERSRTEQVGGYEVTTLYHPPTRSCFLVVRSMASYAVSVTETLPQLCSQEYRR